mgnify:FL=1
MSASSGASSDGDQPRMPWARALALALPGAAIGLLLTVGALVWFVAVMSYLVDLGSRLAPAGPPTGSSGSIAGSVGQIVGTDAFALLAPVLVGLGLGALLLATIPTRGRQRPVLVVLANLVAALAPPLTLGLHLWWPGG